MTHILSCIRFVPHIISLSFDWLQQNEVMVIMSYVTKVKDKYLKMLLFFIKQILKECEKFIIVLILILAFLMFDKPRNTKNTNLWRVHFNPYVSASQPGFRGTLGYCMKVLMCRQLLTSTNFGQISSYMGAAKY